MEFESFTKETLWPILVETVHSLVMFPNHKAYTRDVIITERPDITPAGLAARLKISLGEAMVLLFELYEERRAVSKSLSA